MSALGRKRSLALSGPPKESSVRYRPEADTRSFAHPSCGRLFPALAACRRARTRFKPTNRFFSVIEERQIKLPDLSRRMRGLTVFARKTEHRDPATTERGRHRTVRNEINAS